MVSSYKTYSLLNVTSFTGTEVTPHTLSLGWNKENPIYKSNVFIILITHLEYLLFLSSNGKWGITHVIGTRQDDGTYVFECKYMSVSLTKVCLGGNLGTTSFSKCTHLNSTLTKNHRGEQAVIPKISKLFTLSQGKCSNTKLGGLLTVVSVTQLDREAWWVPVHGVTKSQTWLSE